MSFATVSSCSNNPVTFYDGAERETFPLGFKLSGCSIELPINPLAPECRQWRHYYNDVELNELSAIAQFKYLFRGNIETAVDRAYGKPVHLQPFLVGEEEISVCFTYDEVSNGHYVFWLIAVVSRRISEGEYLARIDHIKKYWLKNG
jgi:hypothetical protein